MQRDKISITNNIKIESSAENKYLDKIHKIKNNHHNGIIPAKLKQESRDVMIKKTHKTLYPQAIVGDFPKILKIEDLWIDYKPLYKLYKYLKWMRHKSFCNLSLIKNMYYKFLNNCNLM